MSDCIDPSEDQRASVLPFLPVKKFFASPSRLRGFRALWSAEALDASEVQRGSVVKNSSRPLRAFADFALSEAMAQDLLG